MGWFKRLRRRLLQRRPEHPPPWVSPQFLGIALCIATLAGGLYVLMQLHRDGPETDSQAEAHREFVGCPRDALLPSNAAISGCGSPEDLAVQWDLWSSEHPDVHILERSPVYEGGRLVGYWVTYQEAAP